MIAIQFCWPEGKAGAFTASYDDGLKEDRRLVEIFYLWGHSYEFARQNNWELIEEFGAKVKAASDDTLHQRLQQNHVNIRNLFERAVIGYQHSAMFHRARRLKHVRERQPVFRAKRPRHAPRLPKGGSFIRAAPIPPEASAHSPPHPSGQPGRIRFPAILMTRFMALFLYYPFRIAPDQSSSRNTRHGRTSIPSDVRRATGSKLTSKARRGRYSSQKARNPLI